jgi:hypothetical protein
LNLISIELCGFFLLYNNFFVKTALLPAAGLVSFRSVRTESRRPHDAAVVHLTPQTEGICNSAQLPRRLRLRRSSLEQSKTLHQRKTKKKGKDISISFDTTAISFRMDFSYMYI